MLSVAFQLVGTVVNMKFLVALSLALVAVSAAPSGHGGVVVSGPSGVVTNHGAVGPAGHAGGWGGAGWAGAGAWGGWGHGDDGQWHGEGLHESQWHGDGVYAGGWGHGAWGWNGGHGGHGVAVVGPATAPAVVAGPAGAVHANGLWGPTAHWGGHWGGHW